MSRAAGRLRASVAPQKRMCMLPTLSSRSRPRLSRASVSSRLSRSPAPRVIRSARTEAMPRLVRRVVDAAGRDQEVQRRRADVLHALGEQRQAVGKRVLVDVLRHGCLLDEASRDGTLTGCDLPSPESIGDQRVPERFDRLVHGLAAAEAEAAVQPDGAVVLRRSLPAPPAPARPGGSRAALAAAAPGPARGRGGRGRRRGSGWRRAGRSRTPCTVPQ